MCDNLIKKDEKKIMLRKRAATTFLCQITDTHLKIVKCLDAGGPRRQFAGAVIEPIPASDNAKTFASLSAALAALGYHKHPVIVSLPRNQATCRYVRLPSRVPREIENIAHLQAASYLPYPADELVTGFGVISTDKQGYTGINLVIAHRDAVNRLLDFFRRLQASSVSVVLSSYGLCNLYNAGAKGSAGPVMVMDSDAEQVEIAVIGAGKMLFSRSFRLSRQQADRQIVLMNEVHKTQEAYAKELEDDSSLTIAIAGGQPAAKSLADMIRKQGTYAVETFTLDEGSRSLAVPADISVASLLGLGSAGIDEYLNLLPHEFKAERRRRAQRSYYVRIALLAAGIMLVMGAAVSRHLDNKSRYLYQLQSKLRQVAHEAKPLEDIEKRFKAIRAQSHQRFSALEAVRELYSIVPAQITLSSFTYEQDKQMIMRGQAPQMETVFLFVSQLEKSQVFKGLSVKINYASQKQVQGAQVVDFEIICSRNG